MVMKTNLKGAWGIYMSYKTTNGLMKHLRDTGIDINGHTEKKQLINTGYYHGYKGYRYFKEPTNRLPFTKYEEVYATIQYDSKIKSLLYGKMMFIETAVRNIALESILVKANSESIQTMYSKVVCSYNNAPACANSEEKKKLQEKKLNLQNSIQANLARAYKANNRKITHFYNTVTYSDVPIWALFEIMRGT